MATDTLPPSDAVDDDDGPLLPVKRASQDAETDITPMIDMTFQLLIFFIVCSKMDASTAPPLPTAKYGAAVPSKASVMITVGINQEGNAVIYKGNGQDATLRLTATEPAEQETEIAKYVEETANAAAPPKTAVLIKAGKGLKRKDVARIEKAVGTVPIVEQIFVAVEEGEIAK